MGGQLLPGLDAADEGVDLVLEVVAGLELGRGGHQRAVLRGVQGEVGAVLQADAALIAHEVDVAVLFPDVLGPGAVDGDDGAGGADEGGDGVVHVVGAIVLGRACPHVGVDVVFHVLAQLAEGLAGHGLDRGVAAAVHDDVQVVDAPVDEGTAAGDRLGGKGAAQAGDGPVGPEADVHVVDVPQLALVDVLLDAVHAVVKAVDHADVQHLAGLVLDFLHLQRLGVGAGGGLLAQHVLPGPQGVDGDDRVDIVGGAHGHGLHLGVLQHVVVVHHGGAAAVLFHGVLRALGDDVAEIFDLCFRVVQVGRDVGRIGDGAAADDSYFHSNTLLYVLESRGFPFL